MARVLTAVVLVPVVLWVVLRADPFVFALLLAVVAVLALREFYQLAVAWAIQPFRRIGAVVAVLLVAAFTASGDALQIGGVLLRADAAIVLVGAVVAVLLRALSRPLRLRESMPDAAVTLMGLLYPATLVALLADIRQMERGPWWIVYMLLVVWLGDTAAYYVGRSIGRRPFSPHVSPQKTWEGAIGGFIVSVVVGGCLGRYAIPLSTVLATVRLAGDPLGVSTAFWQTALLAAPIAVAAQLGDLCESLFKRGAGVKDSGALLPGHGGMLDRIDAMLLATPVLWYFLVLRT